MEGGEGGGPPSSARLFPDLQAVRLLGRKLLSLTEGPEAAARHHTMPPADLCGRQTPISNPGRAQRKKPSSLLNKKGKKENQPHFPALPVPRWPPESPRGGSRTGLPCLSSPQSLRALSSPVSAPLGDPEQVISLRWASGVPVRITGGRADGLRASCGLGHPNPEPTKAPSCTPLSLQALPLSPGASALHLRPRPLQMQTSPPPPPCPHQATAARRTESKDVLIYLIKSPCGQRLAKESAPQNFSFNRIS